jgi:hypothetical protein
VISRHNEIRDELSYLASTSLIPSVVRDEARIHSSRREEDILGLAKPLCYPQPSQKPRRRMWRRTDPWVSGPVQPIVSLMSESQTRTASAIAPKTQQRSWQLMNERKRRSIEGHASSNDVISLRSWSPATVFLARKQKPCCRSYQPSSLAKESCVSIERSSGQSSLSMN